MTLVQFPDRDTPAVPSRRGPEAVIALAEDYWRLAQRIATTEFVPAKLRNRPEAVLAALLSGAERGLGPMESLRSIDVIEGKPSLSAEAMRALVLAAGHDIEIVESTATRCTVIGRRVAATTPPPSPGRSTGPAAPTSPTRTTGGSTPSRCCSPGPPASCATPYSPTSPPGSPSAEEVADELEQPPPTTRRRPASRPTIAGAVASPAPRRRSPPTPPSRPQKRPQQRPPRPPPTSTASPGPTNRPGRPPPPPSRTPPASSWRAASTPKSLPAFPDSDASTRDRWRHALVAVVTRRRPDVATSSSELDLEEQLALSKILTNVARRPRHRRRRARRHRRTARRRRLALHDHARPPGRERHPGRHQRWRFHNR